MTDSQKPAGALVPPHGGRLNPLMAADPRHCAEIREKASSLPRIRMTSRETSDTVMLGMGAFSPLPGFMCRKDYQSVVSDMHTAAGILWPVPVTLAVRADEAARLREGQEAALADAESGEIMGSILVEELYSYDKSKEAKNVFRTDDPSHPGVRKLLDQGDVLVGGQVRTISEGGYPERFGVYYARPAEVRKVFEEKRWKTIAAFQTRNPIHRSHEYCTKIALEVCDGLFIHPLVGKLKDDDIPADVRMRCYEVLLDNYYPKDRVLCRVYPMEMRYAGPREAVLHAIIRQNFGCSHLIVGRDHAGVGKFYGPFDAQDIFDRIPECELHIRPLKIDWTFWCRKCGGMASSKTCPHPKEDHVLISGTELRSMLSQGRLPPEEFSRGEVLKVLAEYYSILEKKGAQ